MDTLSLEPDAHPQRRAAAAAHALREALAATGLLEAFPHCRGEVVDGRAIVVLGEVDATAAITLADIIGRGARQRRRSAARAPERGATS